MSGDLTLYAKWEEEQMEPSGGTITDSWSEIIASINDGTYKNKYRIGDTKSLDLGSEGVVDMQIVGFDADELADGSGKAAITWISKQLLKSKRRMNPTKKYNSATDSYVLGTGSIGGWEHSELRNWLKNDIKPLIPSTVKNAIKSVKKYSSSNDVSGNYEHNAVTIDDVWIPSHFEVFGTTYSSWIDYETEGPTYTELFNSFERRIKNKVDEYYTTFWWLRSADTNTGYFFYVNNGAGIGTRSTAEYPVALGFCL